MLCCIEMKFAVLVLCVALWGSVHGGAAPFINPCTSTDMACMTASALKAIPVLAAGFPALGLSPLDPMVVERVKADQAGLSMDFRNTVVKGLRNCVVAGMRRTGKKIYFDTQCSVTLVGDYTLGGRLLVLPIEGDGKYKIKLRDIVVKLVIDLGEQQKNGEKYWNIENWKHSADVKTNVEFQFQNLFHGNKQLSDTIHQFANSNWRDIFQEVAPPIVKAMVQRIVDEIKKLFAAVPMKDLALD